ncbi:hypothetical protein ACOMHN_020352 [Nucella lapillus]
MRADGVYIPKDQNSSDTSAGWSFPKVPPGGHSEQIVSGIQFVRSLPQRNPSLTMKLFIMTVKLFIIALVIAVLAMDIAEGATGDIGQACRIGGGCGTNARCPSNSKCECNTDYSPDPNNAANCLSSNGQNCTMATQCASNNCENNKCEKSMGSRGAVESVVLMMSVLVISRFL